MRKSQSHVPKSNLEKEYYMKGIKNFDYEPTVDEAIKFPVTDNTDRDFSVQTSPHRRKSNFNESFFNHLEDNWIKWLIAGIGFVIFYLMVDSKIDITRILTNVENLKQDVTRLNDGQEQNAEKIQKQEIEIEKTKMKIEFIEEKKK